MAYGSVRTTSPSGHTKIHSSVCPADAVGRSKTLYLRVSPRGAKSWIQRLNIQGSGTDNSIGRYPAMTLAEARALAFERWKVALGGGDPRLTGGKRAGPTFREAADAVIAMHEPTWRGPKSLQVWTSSLDT